MHDRGPVEWDHDIVCKSNSWVVGVEFVEHILAQGVPENVGVGRSSIPPARNGYSPCLMDYWKDSAIANTRQR